MTWRMMELSLWSKTVASNNIMGSTLGLNERSSMGEGFDCSLYLAMVTRFQPVGSEYWKSYGLNQGPRSKGIDHEGGD